MVNLSVLEHPRIFPPKRLLLGVWGGTLLLAVYGMFAAYGGEGGAFYVWIGIGFIALWQIWSLRWVQVDSEGIRYKNIFQRGRELRWVEITECREEEVRLSRHPYIVVHLSNEKGEGITRPTRINLTNDQVGFETLRTIVREAVPRG